MAQRLDYELGVISKMGYDGYFLITADFINWGKNQGIVFGPGRGSAAGSIVAYVMNITDLDPIKYDLLFERFLNPDRISMPDIDIDIQAGRRGEVIDYVTEKYGEERVSQIITFGTIQARNAIRDTGRVLGYSYDEVDVIAKLVPQPVQGRHTPLAVSTGLAQGKQPPDPELVAEYKRNPRAKQLIDLAIQLEGTIRNNGVHAAGVVIAPAPLVDYVPIQRAQKGGFATQYNMGFIEELGLLKMDFLGLLNLDVINQTLRIIRKVYGRDINLADLPLDDVKTYELLSRGDTTGVFQLESAGMKRYLRELKPSSFNDIIAMVALYRPGPMQFIDSFIDRKHGREKVHYEHPGMEAALGDTYGILVYQEQFMQISKDMCGFTGGQADTLRKAIGKKQRETMAKMKVAFIDGMIEKSGVTRDFAETFWIQLEAFADYCFNKSHSACYGLIAYQTAFLKAHYPSAFMAALLTQDYGNIDRIAIEIAECQRMGMKVLPPDVNESFREFAVVKDTGDIRFGLSAIKNVGTGAIDALLAARKLDGPFMSVEDFAKRVSARECNKKAWESFVKTGAFDSLNNNERGQLIHNLDLLVSYGSKAQKNALSGQIDLFGSMAAEDDLPALHLELPPTAPTTREQLMWEKELMGLYLSSHPLDDFAAILASSTSPLSGLTPESDGKLAKVGGIITTVRKILTKKGDAMAFVGLEDRSGIGELVIFPKLYAEHSELFEPDQVIIVGGKINARDRDGRVTGEPKVIADTVRLVSYETAKTYQDKHGHEIVAPPAPVARPAETNAYLVLQVDDLTNQELLLSMKSLLGTHTGSAEVYLVTGGADTRRIRLPFRVNPSTQLVSALEGLVGAGHVTRKQA